jgi:hypothetical protein
VIGLSLCALGVAGQVLAPPGSASRSADVVAVLEALVRTMAAENCDGTVCYVSVDGKVPGRRFLERLADVPHVRPLPASGPPLGEGEGATFIDLSSVRFRSATRAEASGSVSGNIAGTLLASESCLYHFLRGASGWILLPKETMCIAL